MSYINLENERLRKYIRKTLEIERYGEPFATLIEEVFVREQYILELSPSEFLEDLLNFKNSIKSFRFGNCGPNELGYMDPNTKEIVFDYKNYQNMIKKLPPEVFCRKFFEIFSHECLHGMQNVIVDGHIRNRAGGYNSNVKNRAHAIYEICTQGIAAKIANDREVSEMHDNKVLTGNGYANEIFAIPLIAATFGVSEKDVLKYGVRRREELVEILNKNIGDLNRTATLLNQIENELEYMHSIQYPDESQTDFKNMTYEQRQRATTDVILRLVKICQQVMITRIKSTPLNFNKDIAIQYKYDQKKMIDTLAYEFHTYSYNFNISYSEFLRISEVGEDASYIREALNVFSKIGKDEKGRLMSLAPVLIDGVKTNNFEICEEFGIPMLQNNTFTLVNRANDFRNKRAHEDYNDFRAWDNRRIAKAIYPNLKIEEVEPTPRKGLKSWDDIYTPKGMQKIRDLRMALESNKGKYGIESKEYIFQFLETPEDEMGEFYKKFTRTNFARENFERSFKTDSDKEFLARLIADKFIKKVFESDNALSDLSDSENDIRYLFEPTMQKRGREQLVWAISQLLINDYYQGFSNENSRVELAIIGKKRIFDIIAQPLIDELLNQRRIIPEKILHYKMQFLKLEGNI